MSTPAASTSSSSSESSSQSKSGLSTHQKGRVIKFHGDLPRDYDDESTLPSFEVEIPSDEKARKLDVLRRNPLVPIGAGVTAAVLMGGLFAFNKGSQIWSQRMMRARVFAQGATLGVLALSVYAVKAESNTNPTVGVDESESRN